MSDYVKMWEELGMDLENHDLLCQVLPTAVGDVFLSQETQGPANAEFRTDEDEKTLYWYIEKLLPGEKLTVRIRAAVSDALFGKKAVLLNTAYYYMPEDVPQEPDEDRENPPEWPVDPSKIPPSSWIS